MGFVCAHTVFLVRSVELTTTLCATVRGLAAGSRDWSETISSPGEPQCSLRLTQKSTIVDLHSSKIVEIITTYLFEVPYH
jgi:hypothetical protein